MSQTRSSRETRRISLPTRLYIPSSFKRHRCSSLRLEVQGSGQLPKEGKQRQKLMRSATRQTFNKQPRRSTIEKKRSLQIPRGRGGRPGESTCFHTIRGRCAAPCLKNRGSPPAVEARCGSNYPDLRRYVVISHRLPPSDRWVSEPFTLIFPSLHLYVPFWN